MNTARIRAEDLHQNQLRRIVNEIQLRYSVAALGLISDQQAELVRQKAILDENREKWNELLQEHLNGILTRIPPDIAYHPPINGNT